MADIHIQREHRLGLAKARKVAWRWAETAEEKFGMACTVIEGRGGDVVEFTRAGCDGRLVVAADRFELTARLGMLLGAFSGRIESEIEKNLDDLLGEAASTASAAKANANPKAGKETRRKK